MSRMMLIVVTLTWLIPHAVSAQSIGAHPPVIDVHTHAPMSAGPVQEFSSQLAARLAALDSLNVRFVVLTGVPDVLSAWHPEFESRVGVISSLLFPCVNGLAVMWGRPCFENGEDWPDLEQLREDMESGRIGALGEITTQFLGLGPSDAALEPYFALAEEYDLPVFIHMGPGLPGTNVGGSMGDLPVPEYRATAGNPLLLEEALLKHPSVRVAVMHAGWPLADEMVFLLYQHPQVYAEIGLLQVTEFFPGPSTTRSWNALFERDLVNAFSSARMQACKMGSTPS